MSARQASLEKCVAVVGLSAVVGCSAWWLYRRRRDREQSATKRDDDFKWLSDYVAEVSDGNLQLIDTLDRGRCLVAAKDLPVGCRIRDIPIVPHGSDQGLHLSIAVQKGLSESKCISSSDLLAALDFLASLVSVLAGRAEVSEGASRALWLLYCFPGDAKAEPMIRRWHKRWQSHLAAVPVELVEEAWRRVVPNWRNLLSLTPRGRCYDDANGAHNIMLGHDAICGLWLLMALCEHSCEPSCALAHNGCDLWFTVLRPIPAGEAVTTSYLTLEGLGQPVQMRQDQLSTKWGFTCACTRCSRERSDGKASLLDNPHAALLKLCGSPPDLSDPIALDKYGIGLRELRGVARGLFRDAVEPISYSLLLMEVILLPDSPFHGTACNELLASTLALYGDGDRDARFVVEMLQTNALVLLRRVMSEGSSLLSNGELALLKISDEDETSALHTLQRWYHQYFNSRSWCRRCVEQESGCFYVASAVRRSNKK